MGQARLPQLCRSSPCSSLPRFSLCVTLQSASLLSSLLPSLLPPGTVLGPADIYFHYSLLGVDISTEPFLEEQNFLTEKATAQILACPSVLSSFLASARVEVRLCAGSTVLASACLALAPVLHLAPQGEASYLTSLPLLAPHSLPTHGQGQPSLTDPTP